MSTTVHINTFLGQDGRTLDPLELSVRFHGAVHLRNLSEHVPVQVSIRLPNEYSTLLPMVQDVSTAKKPLTLAMFPFLPLPSMFDPTDADQWQQLAKQIEHCLVADRSLGSKHPECYHLMRELFWMAFVAAYPDFPHGEWPRWNSWIAMDGDFISRWVLKPEDREHLDIPFRVVIWEQFRSIISDELLIRPCVQ